MFSKNSRRKEGPNEGEEGQRTRETNRKRKRGGSNKGCPEKKKKEKNPHQKHVKRTTKRRGEGEKPGET